MSTAVVILNWNGEKMLRTYRAGVEKYKGDAEVFVADGFTFKSMGSTQGANYIVFVEGNDIIASKYVEVLAVSFSSIKFYYDEKYDRSNFIKNIILDKWTKQGFKKSDITKIGILKALEILKSI